MEQVKMPEADLQSVVNMTTESLQQIGDIQRVSDAVYGWLKRCDLAVDEDLAEQLVGHLLGIVGHARAGLDRPTDAAVRVAVEAKNRFTLGHNGSFTTRTRLPIIDLEKLPLFGALSPSKLADALETCDWSNPSIGNKAIVKAAVEALRQSGGAGDRRSVPALL